MTNETRRIICKTANYMTQNGASQSEAWKSAWKLYKEFWTFTLQGTDWTQSQIGLRQAYGRVERVRLVEVNARGGLNHINKTLQVRVGDRNVGFLPEKVTAVLKSNNAYCNVNGELFVTEKNGKYEGKVKLHIFERSTEEVDWTVA